MKIFLFKFLFSFPLLFSLLSAYSLKDLKTGDIVFAKYNDYFDYGITKFFKSDFSHTLIKNKEGLFSFTIMYIGDKGSIYVDNDLMKDKEKILVLRPIIKNKEQYLVYQKCVDEYTNILDKEVSQGKIYFDWDLKDRPNSFVCSTFVFHVLKKCLPDYKKYFKIKNPDRIHYNKKGKPIIYFDNALNKNKFKLIFEK